MKKGKKEGEGKEKLEGGEIFTPVAEKGRGRM